MTTVMIFHEVKDGDVWANAWRMWSVINLVPGVAVASGGSQRRASMTEPL